MNEWLTTLLQLNSISSIALSIFVAYLCGVITSLTPCIFPMIPMTLSVITSVGGKETSFAERLKTLLIYGSGLSLSYVTLGIIAVLGGGFFGSISQSLWVKILIANIFFLIALNTMGWIQLPQFHKNGKPTQSKWSLLGFGYFTGFSLSPCTLPALAVVLAFASQTNLVMGSILLWAYAWGFFTLLLLLGLFGLSFKNKLPKSGPWLRRIEWLLFVICMAIGEWILLSIGV